MQLERVLVKVVYRVFDTLLQVRVVMNMLRGVWAHLHNHLANVSMVLKGVDQSSSFSQIGQCNKCDGLTSYWMGLSLAIVPVIGALTLIWRMGLSFHGFSRHRIPFLSDLQT